MKKIKGYFGSGLFFFLFVLGVIGYSSWISIAWPIVPLLQRRRITVAWAQYNRRILAMTCSLSDRVVGRDRLPPPPYVILVKHQSTWETAVLHAHFPIFALVFKKSLLNVPFFGWALRATNQIAIDRHQTVSAIRQLHERGREELAQGACVVIFPEGTRVPPGVQGNYTAGGVGLALSAGVPIVPVAHNAGRFWGRRSFLKKPGEIQLWIGEPILTTELAKSDRKTILAEVKNRIETMMTQIDAAT